MLGNIKSIHMPGKQVQDIFIWSKVCGLSVLREGIKWKMVIVLKLWKHLLFKMTSWDVNKNFHGKKLVEW